MKILSLIIPVIFILTFIYGGIKKIKLYDSFTEGVKSVIPLILSIFPYLTTVMILTELFEVSGLSAKVENWIKPILNFMGIPKELAGLIIIKPFSGSGGTALLTEIIKNNGVDSYIARCASVIYGGNETIFYIGAIYFSKSSEKRLTFAIFATIVSYIISIILGCLLCKFI